MKTVEEIFNEQAFFNKWLLELTEDEKKHILFMMNESVIQNKCETHEDDDKKCYFIERISDNKWLTSFNDWTNNSYEAICFNSTEEAQNWMALLKKVASENKLIPHSYSNCIITEHLFVNHLNRGLVVVYLPTDLEIENHINKTCDTTEEAITAIDHLGWLLGLLHTTSLIDELTKFRCFLTKEVPYSRTFKQEISEYIKQRK